ncbi:ferredoxin [Gordonia sp. TBRC 11910]|uniref:Ferredoxin n=1 Tax=Gordonia asplenii TaxID=2725283 RepID=A0A848KRJ8_9ACTN|nr:ferredoxin [Gordonia asplenii]NMO00882.1 ferredoxin [Gordonia asplenii]
MDISVDRDLCDNHGQCAIAAPDLFRMTEYGLEYEAHADEIRRADADDAADVCPVQAIVIGARSA